MPIVPVILAGGVGTRLWPMSRSLLPKSLMAIEAVAGHNETMLQATVSRVADNSLFAPPIIVATEEHRFLIADQLKTVACEEAVILLEPQGRNTAPAIALAAHVALANDPEAILLILPSDHSITDKAAFIAVVQDAEAAAQQGHIVSFGVAPTYSETGFGYIRKGDPLSLGNTWHSVRAFMEKPDLATVEQLLTQADICWNSGIIMAAASTIIDALAVCAPSLQTALENVLPSLARDGSFLRPDKAAFLAVPSTSFDKAVMEKTDKAVVIMTDMGWADIGSWDRLWEHLDKDADGNALDSNSYMLETTNSIVRVDKGPTVAAIGLQDMVVVSMRDMVFVAPRDRLDDVDILVTQIRADKGDAYDGPSVVHRPWGTYESTDSGDRFQTKHIIVKPGHKLSLQMHYHRSEHWVVVQGSAIVTIGDEEQLLQQNQSVYIAAGTKHRLENPGPDPLHIIEVQCGSYLGEDDIVRFEDSYGRIA